MLEESPKLREVNIGPPHVACHEEHVLVVVLDAGLAEIGRARHHNGRRPKWVDEEELVVDVVNVLREAGDLLFPPGAARLIISCRCLLARPLVAAPSVASARSASNSITVFLLMSYALFVKD